MLLYIVNILLDIIISSIRIIKEKLYKNIESIILTIRPFVIIIAIAIITENSDSILVVIIDTNVSVATCFSILFELLSLPTKIETNPNKIVNTNENMVVKTPASISLTMLLNSMVIIKDKTIGKIMKQIISHDDILPVFAFLKTLN